MVEGRQLVFYLKESKDVNKSIDYVNKKSFVMNAKPNLSRKQLAKIPLSVDCKSLILGSLLGDGSLKKEPKYANIRFKFRHSIVQKDHFDWKVSLLKEITTKKSVQLQKPDGYSRNEKILFQSSARPQLTELWKLVCDNGNSLVIARHWLNHMTEISLAVWWFDNGSLIKEHRQGVICSESFSKEANEKLANYLQVAWNVTCKVRLRSKEKSHYRLWMNTTELEKFLVIIVPFAVTPFAVKKCLLIYKNPNYQQRWISKMRELLPSEGVHILDNLLNSVDNNMDNTEENESFDELST